MTNQTGSPQPIRQKSYTVGRSYDTASGRVVSLRTDDIVAVTTVAPGNSVPMTTASFQVGQKMSLIPLSATDDVITERPLMTICEVKTPTSPHEPVLDVFRTPGTEPLVQSGGKVSLTPPTLPKSPLDGLSPAPSRSSPSLTRVVRWLLWKQA